LKEQRDGQVFRVPKKALQVVAEIEKVIAHEKMAKSYGLSMPTVNFFETIATLADLGIKEFDSDQNQT